MKHSFPLYKTAIRDYFHDFRRGFRTQNRGWLAWLAGIGMICGSAVSQGQQRNWIAGIPILFALLSGALHRISLPFLMYLVPFSREQREAYLHRMLKVKIAVPLVLGLLLDLAALCLKSLSVYVFVLQMTAVFFISCLCGMLNEDGMQYLASASLVLCYIAGAAMCIICSDSVSRMEFWIIWSVMLLLLLPMTIAAGRRWKRIRGRFADYETVEQNQDGMPV